MVNNEFNFSNWQNQGYQTTINLLTNLFGKLDWTKPQRVSIGKYEAEKILSLNVKNRNPSKRHISWLADQMESGLWIYSSQVIPVSTEGAILDKQHTLMAVIKSGDVSIDFIIDCGVDPDAIQVIDTGKKRSPADILSMEGIKNSALAAAVVPKAVALKNESFYEVKAHGASGRVGGTSKRLKGFLISPQTILEEYLSDEARYEESVLYGNKLAKFSNLVTASFWGAMHNWFSTVEKEKAEKFLLQVARGISESHKSPSCILRRKLELMNDEKIRNGIAFSPKEYVFHFVVAFNRFLKGVDMGRSLSYDPNTVIPKLGE